MEAEHLSLASVTPLAEITPHRPLPRESAARIAGHTVMAWRYNRLPANADARLTRHYKQAVVDGWLQSGNLTSSFDLWMDLKIFVAGDVALQALCANAPLPRFAGASLLPALDIDEGDTDSGEAFNILWHAADAEEMLNQPVLRTALVQVFDALQREPSLSAAKVKSLLSWEELAARYKREDARESLEEAAASAREDWLLKQTSTHQEHRTAAE
jgi:hypothetical protein